MNVKVGDYYHVTSNERHLEEIIEVTEISEDELRWCGNVLYIIRKWGNRTLDSGWDQYLEIFEDSLEFTFTKIKDPDNCPEYFL